MQHGTRRRWRLKPVVGHSAGDDRNPAGVPGCRWAPRTSSGTAGCLKTLSGPGPCRETDASPGSSSGPDTGRRPGPQNVAMGQRVPYWSPGRRRVRLPGAAAPQLAVTLSDTGGQGERAHCRRYARLRAASPEVAPASRTGRSGATSGLARVS